MADNNNKKKESYFDKSDHELPANFPTIEPEILPEKIFTPKAKKVYYTKASWKGVQEIFKCSECETDRNEQDEMILHVLLHVPAHEREALFDKLMEERL